MVIADTNKSSFFYLELELPDLGGFLSENLEQQIETNVDVVLGSIGANSNVYKFKAIGRVVYLFSTFKRKRKGQLNKLIDKNLIDKKLIDGYKTISFLKNEFKSTLIELKKNKHFQLTFEPEIFEGYSGSDLKIFKEKNRWYEWQKEIYDALFYKTGEIKPGTDREIIALYDEKGNSGKSSFFKYLFFNHPEDIGRITYGTASQLRASLLNIGRKKIYIIDLARSKSKNDSEIDLLSAIEDLKNGLVTSNMYGSGGTMLMDIPHILISSNYIFDQSLLSADRWKIYSIKNKKLSNITDKIKKEHIPKKQ